MTDEPLLFDYAAAAPWAQVSMAYGGDDALNRAIGSMAADGKPKDECWEAIWDHEVRRFETDGEFRAAVRQMYETAGVDLLSVTPWVHDTNASERLGQRRDLSRWQARIEAAEWLQKVGSPGEARRVADADQLGVVLNTQNLGGAVDDSVDVIDILYNEGVRIFQLTYNRQNLLGTGCNDPSEGGLSALGRAAVDRVNQLGGIVDLSHCGRQTTLDAVDYSEDPVAFTHTTCQGVAHHYRGKSDEELEALAAADGYVGVACLPWFIAPGVDAPTLDVLCEHLDYARSVLGDSVGLGTDFFPADVRFPDELLEYYKQHIIELGFDREKVEARTIADGLGEFETYEDWPAIESALRARFREDVADGMLGENFHAFWERVVSG